MFDERDPQNAFGIIVDEPRDPSFSLTINGVAVDLRALVSDEPVAAAPVATPAPPDDDWAPGVFEKYTPAPLPKRGSPADRGSADAYYGRASRPHKIIEAERRNFIVELTDPDEIKEYLHAYASEDDRKDWR